MLEKRTHQLGVIPDFLQLPMHALLQFFAFQQRSSGYARAFGMAPHQLVRIKVGRIAGQEVQGKTTFRTGHIFLDHRFLVRGPAPQQRLTGLQNTREYRSFGRSRASDQSRTV